MVQIVQGQLFTSTEDQDEEDDESYLRKLSNVQTKKKKKTSGVKNAVKGEPDGIINVYAPTQAEARKECKDPMIQVLKSEQMPESKGMNALHSHINEYVSNLMRNPMSFQSARIVQS